MVVLAYFSWSRIKNFARSKNYRIELYVELLDRLKSVHGRFYIHLDNFHCLGGSAL